MDRPVDPPATLADRHYEAIVDSQVLRSAIAESLAVMPIADEGLRRGVWTFVAAERNAGTSPGHVIMALTELVEAAKVRPATARPPLMRRVILWCVEAYFGHLGGDVVGRDGDSLGDSPRVASNR
jgi:hypothetical protein